MRIALLAGERSGDVLGASLASELQQRRSVQLCGVVGPAMELAGVESIGRTDALSIVGLTAVVAELPRLWRLANQLEHDLVKRAPDCVVTIDSPSFHLRLAPRLRRRGLRVVHWVAPQVWAWRRHRAARVARSVDQLACLFPFEPALFGDNARFTGHPAVQQPISLRPDALGIAAGSRASERSRLGPVFRQVAIELGWPVVEAVPPGMQSVVPGAVEVDSVSELAQHVRFALVAAGTATLELAVAGVPMVAAYQLDPATFHIARRLVRVRSVVLPNLLLGRDLVPEHVQDLDPRAIRADLERLSGAAGDRMSAELLEVRSLLGADPIGGVADMIEN